MDSQLSKAAEPGTSPTLASEKRDLLARLLARLAHEIRNPLSSLDIHVQLLEEDIAQAAPEARPQLASRLEIIQGELKRLENIVKRFLRLASPSALELEEVNLLALVGHVRKLLGPEAAAREVELTTMVDPKLPVIRADGGQLTQALLNLVINALQAVSRGGRIVVRVEESAADNSILVQVHDSGPGVPPEKLAAVFEPYFTTKEEGSGLGLWIAQQIAAAHSGTLEVANAPEGGAVFRLRLPRFAREESHG